MKWTVHIEGGPMRVNHAAVCIGDKIYSFGGYCSSEEYKDFDPIPVYALDTSTLRWSPVNYKIHQESPFQRYGHTVVSYGDKVYMWGGRNNAVPCDTLCCFDTKTFTWTTPPVSGMVPCTRDGHTACRINNRMYVFGGFEYLTDQYSQELHYLNLDTMQWSSVNHRGIPPSHRDFHTAVAIGQRMYIYGGRAELDGAYHSQEEMYCSQVYYFDTVAEKWVTTFPNGTWPEGRRSHSAWVHNGFMYVFGGFNGILLAHFNDLHRYSVKENYWQYVDVSGNLPCNRRRQACLLHKDKVYMFGGTSPNPVSFGRALEANFEGNPEMLIDNSDLHILDYSPTLKTLCILTVLEHNLDWSSLPRDIIIDIRTMTVPNRISKPVKSGRLQSVNLYGSPV